MLKSLCRSFSIVLALSLLLPFAHDAGARAPEDKPSFKSGFSSQKPAQKSESKPAQKSESKPSYKQNSSGGGSGGFGSFSGAPADSGHRSESASSRQLTRKQAEENALRTLEERRARSASRAAERDRERDREWNREQNREQNRERSARREPDDRAPSYPAGMRRSDLDDLAGALGNAINRRANANNTNYGGNRQAGQAGQAGQDRAGTQNDWGLGPKGGTSVTNAGTAGRAGAQQSGASFARLFLWFGLLALVAVAAWFGWRRVRRKREAGKPNYSFERN